MRRMVELCSGSGVLSETFKRNGWDVLTIDNDPTNDPIECRDVLSITVDDARRWKADYIHSAPPCTEFSREFMPWHKTGIIPSTEIAEHCYKLSQEAQVYTLENTKGAIRYLNPLFGDYITSASGASCFMWGNLWNLDLRGVHTHKNKLSSSQHKERAIYPQSFCDRVYHAVEYCLTHDRRGNKL